MMSQSPSFISPNLYLTLNVWLAFDRTSLFFVDESEGFSLLRAVSHGQISTRTLLLSTLKRWLRDKLSVIIAEAHEVGIRCRRFLSRGSRLPLLLRVRSLRRWLVSLTLSWISISFSSWAFIRWYFFEQFGKEGMLEGLLCCYSLLGLEL